MSQHRVLPHQVANDYSISVVEWWYQFDGGQIRELPELLEGWDYNTHTVIGVDVELGLGELSKSTGLACADISLMVAADCPAVGERFFELSSLVDGRLSVGLEIPRGRAADSLLVSAHLVANRSHPTSPSSQSVRNGARLFDSESRRVRLEGLGGRFPVELCDFSVVGFESAPWTIITDFEDLNDSFLGSVRLFVNSEHPLGAAAAQPGEGHNIAKLMQLDTMRLLVSEIASSGMFEADADWAETSVAHVVDSMCLAYFNQSLVTVIGLLQTDPSSFERLLYESVSFSEVHFS
ncbi:hypothetical protein [Dietzia maris]|uniref:hypothetical protein n=1 Tax=Dietzia maris TaxID=37915 RepID=UPI0037CC274A